MKFIPQTTAHCVCTFVCLRVFPFHLEVTAFFLYNLMDSMSEKDVQAQKDKLQKYFKQLQTQVHTPHTDVLYIQFIHNLPALKELTHSDLRWFAVCNQTRIIHDKHTRQNTWPPRCAPFLKSERLSWDIQTCCGRLNHALHFLAKGYVLTGRLEFSKTVSWSSVGGITEDFSFGRANSAKPASAEIILTWNDIFHHSSYSGCCGVNMLRVYRHSDTFNYQ